MAPAVFVTGASGFIASHCIRLLLQQGYKVKATVRSTKDHTKIAMVKDIYPNAAQNLEIVEFDLLQTHPCTDILKGCQYVFHIASPVYDSRSVEDPSEMILPAVNGTLKVLQAVSEVGSVKRVVLTSSIASICALYKYRKQPYTEEDWTDLSEPGHTAYIKSKTLAEKAAWDFVNKLPENKRFELAVINPSWVFGPPVIPRVSYTMSRIFEMMQDPNSVILNRGCPMIDVRDVAMAHLNAMHAPAAAGHRHIVSAHSLFYLEIAEILRKEFESKGFSIPSTVSEVKGPPTGLPPYEDIPTFKLLRMTEVLAIEHRSAREMVIEAAYGLIEMGLVKMPQH